jgi:hypothetical protein
LFGLLSVNILCIEQFFNNLNNIYSFFSGIILGCLLACCIHSRWVAWLKTNHFMSVSDSPTQYIHPHISKDSQIHPYHSIPQNPHSSVMYDNSLVVDFPADPNNYNVTGEGVTSQDIAKYQYRGANINNYAFFLSTNDKYQSNSSNASTIAWHEDGGVGYPRDSLQLYKKPNYIPFLPNRSRQVSPDL